jgi:WD40 repeat protein
MPQGGFSQPVTVSVNPANNFASPVQITLANLPAGVTSTPASPFTIAAGADTSVILGASLNSKPGSSTVTAQAVSGALSHSATLALSIQTSVLATLPRTAYQRTDAIASADDPPGEPHHRHVAYDPSNKHLFVANRAMNRVEVFSTTDHSSVAQIDVPGASSADLSPDGATIWVGAITQQIIAIDTTSLQVKSRYAIQPMSPVPNTSFDRPEEVIALVGGNGLLRVRQSSAAQSALALWNPATNSSTSLVSVIPNGLGAMARTGDHSKVLVAAGDASGNLIILDSNGNVLTGPLTAGSGMIPLVAANPDGTHFAVVLVSNGASQILLLDGGLKQIAAQPSAGTRSLAFSRDGKFLYASSSVPAAPAIQVYDGQSLQPIGQLPDLAIQGVPSEIEEADETSLLFGIANRGVSFIDAAVPAVLPGAVPAFAFPPVAQPSEGAATGGAAVTLNGQNFEATAIVTFGSQAAPTATVASASQLQTVSPPTAVSGAVNVAAYFPSGWLAMAPDSFSYGPQILKTLPNAGNKTGGDVIQVFGYGLGTDANTPTVTIGGAAATVQKVESIAALEPSLGLDPTYPFSLEAITVQTPSGTPGKADIVVKSANGNATASAAFQYLQSVQVNANPGLYKFLLYDRARQYVYLSATDHVDVFDLQAGSFKPGGLPIYCPSRMLAGPCPDADVRGLALTPDGTQLLVADFGSQNIFLLNPDSPGMVSYVSVNVPGFGPARVAATSAQTAFVSLVPVASSPGPCTGCLAQLNLTASTIAPAPQPEVTTMTGTPLLQADAAGDRVFLAFAASSGGSEALWSAASPNAFSNFSVNENVIDIATSADGSLFATNVNGAIEIRDVALNLIGNRTTPELEQFPTGVTIPGIAMHPGGGLVYQPFLNGPAPMESASPTPNPNLRGGIDIFDTHSGRLRLRIVLPEPLAACSADTNGLLAQFLSVDETGQRLFAITNSGLTVVQLANVPLAIGTISPASAPAAGGTTITIRGSNFQTGTTATIAGKNAAVTLVDANTLTLTTPAMTAGPQHLVLANPDGETTTLDAALTAN